MSQTFDATITLNDHHPSSAGMFDRPADAVAAVRSAVQRIAGAERIDVEADSYPPSLPVWVTLHQPGRGSAPDTAKWRDLQRQVGMMATVALVGTGKPF